MSISIGHAFEVSVSIALLKKNIVLKPGTILFYQHKTKHEVNNHPVWDSLFLDNEQAYLYYKDEYKALYITDIDGNTVTLYPQTLREIDRYMEVLGVSV